MNDYKMTIIINNSFVKKVVFYSVFLIVLFYPRTVFAQVWNCDCGPCAEPAGETCCIWCENDPSLPGACGTGWCTSCSSCGGGACFTGDTKIATPSGEKEIKDIKEGDVVKSFSAETGEIKEATVTAIHKRQVQGYYILKTESGREIKVTGEHPILAVKQENISDKLQPQASNNGLLQNLFSSLAGLVERIF